MWELMYSDQGGVQKAERSKLGSGLRCNGLCCVGVTGTRGLGVFVYVGCTDQPGRESLGAVSFLVCETDSSAVCAQVNITAQRDDAPTAYAQRPSFGRWCL